VSVPESRDGRELWLARCGGDVSLLMTEKVSRKTDGDLQLSPEDAIRLGRQLMELGQEMLDEQGGGK
jgi:hypothetical protein